MKRLLLFFFLFTAAGQIKSQISSKGKEFYFSFMECDLSPDSLLVYVTGDKSTTFTIENLRTSQVYGPYSYTANTVRRIKVDNSNFFTVGEGLFNQGLYLKAKEDVSVYVLNVKEFRTSGTFCLPATAIPPNTEYVVASYPPTYRTGATYGQCEFLIASLDNNCQVDITPTAKTATGKAAGVTYTVTLQRGQVYQVQSDKSLGSTANPPSGAGDLTGSIVKVANGCKKINVFSGAESAQVIAANCLGREHMFAQMYPTTIWGKKYYLTPYKNMTKGYLYRVICGTNNTTIYINGVSVGTKNRGQWYQGIVTTSTTTMITADQPVQVAEYMLGQQCNGANDGDPSLLISPDVSQTLTKAIVGTSNTKNLDNHFVNIIVQDKFKGRVKLNGSFVGAGSFIGLNSGYVYAPVSLTNGAHVIECDSGFQSVSYGYGNFESYAYSAGALFENLQYDFKFTRTNKCPGAPVKFTSTGSTALGYTWDYSDGSPRDTGKTSTHVFKKPGSYPVKLILKVPGVCNTYDSVIRTKVVDVFNGPVLTFPDTIIRCSSTINEVLDAGTNVKFIYKWQDSAVTQKYTVTSPGKYWVRVTDTATNCIAKDSVIVIKPNAIVLSLSYDTARNCLRDNFFSISSKPILTNDSVKLIKWVVPVKQTFISPRLRIKFDTANLYNVKYYIFTKNGCFDSLSFSIPVRKHPFAKFGVDSIINCPGKAFNFSDSSYTTSDPISYYNWSYGDGDTSILQNPSKYYIGGDSFKVRQIVTTNLGCSDTAYKTIYMHAKPKAIISMPDTLQCLKTNAVFAVNKSTIARGTLDSSVWDASGTPYINKDTVKSIKYGSAGIYVYKLIVTSDKNCSDTTTKSLRVASHPAAKFTINTKVQCLRGNSYVYTNTSNYGADNIASQKWSFGDASYDTAKNPMAKSYGSASTFNVYLAVKNKDGCPDTAFNSVDLKPMPKALIGVVDTALCVKYNNFKFSDRSTISSGSLTWNWDFGDGNTSAQQNPNNSYATYGYYPVRLIVNSAFNCADTADSTMHVKPSPIADFALDKANACQGQATFTVINSSSFPGGSLFTYNYDFGDGTTATTNNPVKTYAGNLYGSYNVRLINIGNNNCKDTTFEPLTIHPKPIAKYTVDDSIQCFDNHSFVITSTSSVPTGTIAVYNWNLGPGKVFSTMAIAPQTYSTVGDYNLWLDIVSDKGCKDTITGGLHTIDNPVVDFTGDAVCLGEDITFTGIANITTGTITSTQWKFGDGNTSIINPETHLYGSAGNYDVTFTATSDQGCVGSKTITGAAVIHPVPDAKFDYQKVANRGIENDVQFTDLSSGATNWHYEFGNGDESFLQNPFYTYLDTGHFKVILTVGNNEGCFDSTLLVLYMYPELNVFIPNSFSPNRDGLNDVFKIAGVTVAKKYKVEIINRWGEIVFKSTKPGEGWDGTFNGEKCMEGYYAYYVYVIGIDGKHATGRGSVHLLR